MRINTEHEFVFVSTPKAGTHTIYEMLNKHYARGLREYGFHANQIPEEYKHYFRWTVCRNPYTRAVSLWWSGCRLHSPDRYGFRRGCGTVSDFGVFIEWLSRTPQKQRNREPLMKSQTEWMKIAQPIKALHLETLQEEITNLPFWKPGIQLSKLNTTTQKIKDQEKEEGRKIECPHWKELCENKRVQEAVIRWAGEDFEKFGYSIRIDDYEG